MTDKRADDEPAEPRTMPAGTEPAANEPAMAEPAATEPAADEPAGYEPLRHEVEYADLPPADSTLPAAAPTDPTDDFDTDRIEEPEQPARLPDAELAGPPEEPDRPPAPEAPEPWTAAPPAAEPWAAGAVPPPPPHPGGFGPPPGPPPPPPPPPPGGFGPPAGGGVAGRYGLVRPVHGRYLAGVCAAIARATNTDPLLWRVLLVVLSFFGGVGLLVYLLGWLLIPNEGDNASPLEALLGRGRSSTSAATVLAVGALAVLMLAVALSGDLRTIVLGVAVVIGAVLLITRNGGAGHEAQAPPPAPGVPGTPEPGSTTPPPYPPQTAPTAPTAPTQPLYPPSAPAGAPGGGFRPPLAPGGPYASSSPYAASIGYPGLAAPAVPPPPAPPERSRLGRVVASLICIALAVLVVVDLTGAFVPAAAYLAVPLAVVGLGLVIGAWLGRARWLVAPGVVLTVLLLFATAAGHWGGSIHRGSHTGSVVWAPTSVDQLQREYRLDAGDGTLDLSRVDFTDRSSTVDVSVNLGNLVIILPPNVDVDIDAKVDMGEGDVLGQSWNGIDKSRRHFTDNGADGPGGGRLTLTANVDLGKLEVQR